MRMTAHIGTQLPISIHQQRTKPARSFPRQGNSHGAYLAPNEHSAEDDLESVEEVVADDDDRGAAGGPALAGTDGLYTRCGRR